ncbi:unnamed protein product [Sphenostylis stenocarpa]|uniref:Band 7 domain-containing protein n=1 Tax=Sphenostylis stenocarpa TaxID=92480 RepID=A0AA86RVA3_9FABA|nr:unnamed protein product [Sphenostylis stenocarpa]
MKNIGTSSKWNAVFIPHGPGAVQDVASQIRTAVGCFVKMGQVFGLLRCVQVEQPIVAIKEVFGKFKDFLEPGCHCVSCYFSSCLSGELASGVDQLDVPCETKTKAKLKINVTPLSALDMKKDIEPDRRVKRAMNEINAAGRLRVASSDKAEAEKILKIKRAEGEAESKYEGGQAIVDEMRDGVLVFSEKMPGTTPKNIMDAVIMTEYFDTMKDIGASTKSSGVFIPYGPGGVQDVASQIRDDYLQGNTTNS